MPPTTGRPAARVAAGILVSRVLGYVREGAFAYYFGISSTADAFRAALRIPNIIRNLLGEGTLSASFIPAYAGLLERGSADDARRLAGAIASLLIVLTAAATLLGIALAPVITDFAAPGFSGETRDLTVTLVRILFPMSAVMILSAWCLGVLNTHRRFFLSYAAPAVWNVAQIAVMIGLGAKLAGASLAAAVAWGALGGGVLQIAVQLPATLRLVGKLEWSLSFDTPGVRQVVTGWLPVVFGAGVVQVSSIIDTQLGSLLAAGAVATLSNAQLLANLPVGLFGVSVAAAALPDMSRDVAGDGTGVLRDRVVMGLQRLAFFVIPSAFALGFLGRPIVALLFERGAFGAAETALVTSVLAAYAIGLPAQASVKLLASGHYALGDTRRPVRIAALSVLLSAGFAFVLMRELGVPGIALGASAAAYVNAVLLARGLATRVGGLGGAGTGRSLVVCIGGAILGTTVGFGLVRATGAVTPWIGTPIVLGGFGLAYGALTYALGHPDARRLLPGRFAGGA